MPESNPDNRDFEKKVLEFTETSIRERKDLEKRASDAEAKVAELEKENRNLKADKENLQKKASAEQVEPKPVFSEDILSDVSSLLSASGFVKQSSEEVQEAFKKDPDSVLSTFRDILGSDGDAAELTSIKSSSEHKTNLWELAASEK